MIQRSTLANSEPVEYRVGDVISLTIGQPIVIVSDYSKVEEQERSWHRRHAVWRAHRAGATFTEIGNSLGLSRSRPAAMYQRADREVRDAERSPLTRELSRVEFVDRAQILNAERACATRNDHVRELAKRDKKIARLETLISELKARLQDEIGRLKLRVMDDILIVRDGHFIGSRPHASGRAFVQVTTAGGIKELPLLSFCAREGDLVHHAFVVIDKNQQVAPTPPRTGMSTWSSVPPPFSAWCLGGQTLPTLPEAAA